MLTADPCPEGPPWSASWKERLRLSRADFTHHKHVLEPRLGSDSLLTDLSFHTPALGVKTAACSDQAARR